MYGPTSPSSALYTALCSADLVDQGMGATWQALENRTLVRCCIVPDAFGVPLLEVQLTPLGRKVVRAATGELRPSPRPKASCENANGRRSRGSTLPATPGKHPRR